MNRFRRFFIPLLLFLVPGARAEVPALYAATSLTTALQELMQGPAAEQELRARLSLASSSTLAKQIVEGAPADLFFSANIRWMEFLEKEGLIAPGTRVDLLGNRLVVIAPKGEGFPVEAKREFDFAAAFSGRLALGDPEHVPAGIYTRQALTSLGWWKPLLGRLAPAPHVRAALVFVERGECPAGVVYATDVAASKRVEVLASLPASTHEPIVYPVAALKGRDTRPVRDLLTFLQSPIAAELFARHGFTVIRKPDGKRDTP